MIDINRKYFAENIGMEFFENEEKGVYRVIEFSIPGVGNDFKAIIQPCPIAPIPGTIGLEYHLYAKIGAKWDRQSRYQVLASVNEIVNLQTGENPVGDEHLNEEGKLLPGYGSSFHQVMKLLNSGDGLGFVGMLSGMADMFFVKHFNKVVLPGYVE